MTDNILNITQFQHKLEPFRHQRNLLEKTWDDEYFAFFWEMGGGKTKISLDTAAMLYMNKEIDSLLIFAPKGAYLNWVFNEIDKHMTDQVDYRVAHWASAARKEQRRDIEAIMDPDPEALDIFVVNTEAMSSKRGYEAAKLFEKNHKAVMT